MGAMLQDSAQGRPLRPPVNLDWTRDPPPARLTEYQKYIRGVDWSQTSLGPMHSWQRELRQTVLFMMAEVSPVILYWGKDFTMIYNEAYIPLVGKQHPQIQGRKAWEVFPGFWDGFSRIIQEQWQTGEARTGEASMLILERHGFLEETYFNWQLIPVIGDDGFMLGSYGRPLESSHDIIHSRRAASVQALSQRIGNTNTFSELWQGVMEDLGHNDKDVPLAMIYTVPYESAASGSPRQPKSKCKLEAYLGIPEGHPCLRRDMDMREQDGLAPHVLTAFTTEVTQRVWIAGSSFEFLFEDIKWRGFDTPCQEYAFVPVKAAGSTMGIFVFGLNPRLRFEGDYQEYIQIIADVLSPQMTKLTLADEVRHRDEAAQRAVLEFQRSEMKFARFADRSPLGLTFTNVDGKVMYANQAWSNFCGLDPSEAEFTNWMDSVYEEDLPMVHREWHGVTQLQQSSTFQVRSRRPFVGDGMRSPYHTGIVAIYPDLDQGGNVATVMGLVMDISELKWTEKQLRLRQNELEESEAKYRVLAEHAPIGAVRTDAEGYVQFANDAWRAFYNFSRDHKFEFPQPWLAQLNQEDVPLASQFFTDIQQTKSAKTVEVRLRRRKTSADTSRATPAEIWLLATGFAELNPDGSIDGIMFWVTDITDQKAAEKILTDKMEEAIRLKNTQERFVDMISHEIRNPLSAILHCGEEIVEAMKNCLALMDTPSSLDHTDFNDTSSHSLTKHHVSSALEAANTIMYCVQHQKQIVDDVLTLSKLDADLLVVSPTPVQPADLVRSAIKMFEPELKAATIELAFEVDKSLDDLKVDWIMLDPNRFLQIVINLITNAIKFTRGSQTRRIVVGVTARDTRPPRYHQGVRYVPRREAPKPDGERTHENSTDLSIHEDNNLYLCFSVADTGKGLSDSECTLLFHRFTQASPRTHIEYGGSGLGLFISRQITEMLGGEIGVGSEPGKGATFAFYIRTRRVDRPRRASADAAATSVSPHTFTNQRPGSWAPEATPNTNTTSPDHPRVKKSRKPPNSRTASNTTDTNESPRKRRILVVEDNLVNQKVLCKQLRNRGFLVDAANHGREALDVLTETHQTIASITQPHPKSGDPSPPRQPFDVILCDIEMPVMGGIECVTEIRRLEKEGQLDGHVPIIGVTANVRSKQVNAAIEVGMDGVTTKPYRIEELIEHIDRVSTPVPTPVQTPVQKPVEPKAD